MRAQVEVAERERRQERQEETGRLNRLEQKLIQTQTELQTERTEREQTDKQLQTALTENAQLHTQMTELIDQITEITEATRAQTETDHFCTAGLKQKLAAEQDRVATAQIQIELSTEMNEQLQLQVTDLTTAVEQLRDRPTEHARKQTETLTVTAVQKAAASQGMGTTTTDIKSAFGDMQKEMMQGFQQMQFLAGPPPPQQQQHAWQQPQMGQQSENGLGCCKMQ